MEEATSQRPFPYLSGYLVNIDVLWYRRTTMGFFKSAALALLGLQAFQAAAAVEVSFPSNILAESPCHLRIPPALSLTS
jgi:hypothetical protein